MWNMSHEHDLKFSMLIKFYIVKYESWTWFNDNTKSVSCNSESVTVLCKC